MIRSMWKEGGDKAGLTYMVTKIRQWLVTTPSKIKTNGWKEGNKHD